MSAVVLRASSQSGTLGLESLQNGYSMCCISSGLSKGLVKALVRLPGELVGFGATTAHVIKTLGTTYEQALASIQIIEPQASDSRGPTAAPPVEPANRKTHTELT